MRQSNESSQLPTFRRYPKADLICGCKPDRLNIDLPAKVPYGHWKTLTFIAALRHRIDAPFVIDGPINGELFTAYVEQVLAPTLNRGDIVTLDNLGSHKGKATRQTIREKGAHLLFLPPYSPDLNPIEQLFAKLKHLMRKIGGRGPIDADDPLRRACSPALSSQLPRFGLGCGSVRYGAHRVAGERLRTVVASVMQRRKGRCGD